MKKVSRVSNCTEQFPGEVQLLESGDNSDQRSDTGAFSTSIFNSEVHHPSHEEGGLPKPLNSNPEEKRLQNLCAPFLPGASMVSSKLCELLSSFLSPTLSANVPESILVNNSQLIMTSSVSKKGGYLSEEQKRAERNRKGRERSLRTRRRNAARRKMLEDTCARYLSENGVLRELLRYLHGTAPSGDEQILKLLRTILFGRKLEIVPEQEEIKLKAIEDASGCITALTTREDRDGSNERVPFEFGGDEFLLPSSQFEKEHHEKNMVSRRVSGASSWNVEEVLFEMPQKWDNSITTNKILNTDDSTELSKCEEQGFNSREQSCEASSQDRPSTTALGFEDVDALLATKCIEGCIDQGAVHHEIS